MSEEICQNLPVIETDRLVLRPLRLSDVDAIESIAGRDYEIARWLSSFQWPYVQGSVEAFVSELVRSDPLTCEAVFAVTVQGTFVGVTAIEGPGDLTDFPEHPSLGYWIGRSFQRRGIATEAVIAALNWAFEAHNAPQVGARAFHNNAASISLLTKLGFVEAGSEVRYSKALKRNIDNIVFLLNRETFAVHKRTVEEQMPIS